VHAEALAVMVAVTADLMLGFGDPSILPYSANAMVGPLSCAEPSTGNVQVFLCWTWTEER
jgi:hypothetical protein